MNDISYQNSSGNVFQDLALPNAKEMQTKAKLVSHILSIIEKKGWNQEQAASALNLTQPKISLLRRGQFNGFSLEKLLMLLNKLNQDVEIVIKNKRFTVDPFV